jgi:hypothetical protein
VRQIDLPAIACEFGQTAPVEFPPCEKVFSFMWPTLEKKMKAGACLIVSIAFIAGAAMSPARADTVTLSADLKGSNEVPPNNSPATGKAEAKFDTATRSAPSPAR